MSACQNIVRPGASICTGCGAEIVRGASRKEKSVAGCLSGTVGLLITMVAIGFVLRSSPLGASNKFGLAILLGLLLSALIFNILGRAFVRLLFRSRLRFFRAYQHR